MVSIDLGTQVNRYGFIQVLAWLLTDLAAANWLLVELFDVNLVSDYLSADVAGIVFVVVGVAGVVGLAETVTDVEVIPS